MLPQPVSSNSTTPQISFLERNRQACRVSRVMAYECSKPWEFATAKPRLKCRQFSDQVEEVCSETVLSRPIPEGLMICTCASREPLISEMFLEPQSVQTRQQHYCVILLNLNCQLLQQHYCTVLPQARCW